MTVHIIQSDSYYSRFYEAKAYGKNRDHIQPTFVLCNINSGDTYEGTHVVSSPDAVRATDKKLVAKIDDPKTLIYFENNAGRIEAATIAKLIAGLNPDQKEMVELAYFCKYNEPLPVVGPVARARPAAQARATAG